jgi:hypothetical protein
MSAKMAQKVPHTALPHVQVAADLGGGGVRITGCRASESARRSASYRTMNKLL